jgi:hypothetical protein
VWLLHLCQLSDIVWGGDRHRPLKCFPHELLWHWTQTPRLQRWQTSSSLSDSSVVILVLLHAYLGNMNFCSNMIQFWGARSSIVGWGTCYKLEGCGFNSRRGRWILFFIILPNPSSSTMALEFTQPLTDMSTRNLPGDKGQPVHKSGNFTAICVPTVYKIWDVSPFSERYP